eukprot:1162182-Pyramimonas_sp.AAC.1
MLVLLASSMVLEPTGFIMKVMFLMMMLMAVLVRMEMLVMLLMMMAVMIGVIMPVMIMHIGGRRVAHDEYDVESDVHRDGDVGDAVGLGGHDHGFIPPGKH